jgi:hypothetical protein
MTRRINPRRRPPRDGSSFAHAILIDQWRWQAQHCPGATVLLQMLAHDGDRRFDILLLELKSGDIRRVYFDVTALFPPERLKRMRAKSQKHPKRR